RIVTLSESSKQEIVDLLHLPADNIAVVPPGVDPVFSPGGQRSPEPLVAAVGRLVPVKRFDLLVDALVELKTRVPALQAVIVGEGMLRDALEAQVRAAGAEAWLALPGRPDGAHLVAPHRQARALPATSLRQRP